MSSVRLTPAEAQSLFASAGKRSKYAPKSKAERAAQPENQLEDQVTQYLRVKGWFVDRHHSGRFRGLSHPGIVTIGEKGKADWGCIRPCAPAVDKYAARKCFEHFFLELKAPGKSPSPDQLTWGRKATLQGFVYVWFDNYQSFTDWYGKNY